MHIPGNGLGFCFIRSPDDCFDFIMCEDIGNKRTVSKAFMLRKDICVIPKTVEIQRKLAHTGQPVGTAFGSLVFPWRRECLRQAAGYFNFVGSGLGGKPAEAGKTLWLPFILESQASLVVHKVIGCFGKNACHFRGFSVSGHYTVTSNAHFFNSAMLIRR